MLSSRQAPEPVAASRQRLRASTRSLEPLASAGPSLPTKRNPPLTDGAVSDGSSFPDNNRIVASPKISCPDQKDNNLNISRENRRWEGKTSCLRDESVPGSLIITTSRERVTMLSAFDARDYRAGRELAPQVRLDLIAGKVDDLLARLGPTLTPEPLPKPAPSGTVRPAQGLAALRPHHPRVSTHILGQG